MLKNKGNKLAGRITVIAAAVSGVFAVLAVTMKQSDLWAFFVNAAIFSLFVPVATAIWWGITYKESVRKPGATPLIAAVIVIPACALLYFIGLKTTSSYIGSTLLVAMGVFWGVAAVVLLIVGVVKKLAA